MFMTFSGKCIAFFVKTEGTFSKEKKQREQKRNHPNKLMKKIRENW